MIYPVRNWALNKQELHVLTSRQKKVDLELMLQREDDEEDIRFPIVKDKSVSNTDILRDRDTPDSGSSVDEVEKIKTNTVNPEIIINDNIGEGTQTPPNKPIISQEYAKPNALIKDAFDSACQKLADSLKRRKNK